MKYNCSALDWSRYRHPDKTMMSAYVSKREFVSPLRLPLSCSIDLTYRCNLVCRHCWLWLPLNAREQEQELTLDEIRRLSDEARALGTREWKISGGEPMARPDFADIFECLTGKARNYSLNTNGTLITPKIAQLLRRPGTKMISLYGATPEVYDHVTRNPGGFEQAMRGFAYLREAGVEFVVQMFPMRDNWHQWEEMQKLASSLSPHTRIGGAWLYLSSDGNPVRNQEIKRQRLHPADAVRAELPLMSEDDDAGNNCGSCQGRDGKLYASCIQTRTDCHIDPYGKISFCFLIKDPALRYDWRKGNLKKAWEEFIPSLAGKTSGTEAYREGCQICDLRSDCRWCATYSYLEFRDHSPKLDYLCAIAKETRRYKDNWRENHRRFYRVGGVTIQVDSDLPFTDDTYHARFKSFRVEGPGEDTVKVRHHFEMKELRKDWGREVYQRGPWTIFQKGRSWIYQCAPAGGIHRLAVFNNDHTRGNIFSPNDRDWRGGNSEALTFTVTDQILLTRLMADRQGCLLHSAGAILNDKGLLFVGHSGAGKTTTTRLIQDHAEILCDDRNIVRRHPDGFRLYGTWCHGESPAVSSSSAPLKAVLFLRQSPENRLVRIHDRKAVLQRLLPVVVRAFAGGDWWDKTLDVLLKLAAEVPCYEMEFDKSGRIVPLLKELGNA